MKYLISIFLFMAYMSWCVGLGINGTHPSQTMNNFKSHTNIESEKAEILKLIDDESTAFWDKDFEAYARCWVHAPYIRTMGWWEAGGVTVVKGWEERGPRTKGYMNDFPEPNPQNVRRENINMRIYEDAAWVTFDQYGNDTGEPVMDMPGLSRETRFLEKQDGKWKIVYVGWLLEGEEE